MDVKTTPEPCPTLTTLPHEILLAIFEQLSNSPERLLIRRVCRLFAALVDRPDHSELIHIEAQPWAMEEKLLTCGGCERLRRNTRFHDGAISQDYLAGDHSDGRMIPGGQFAKTRFCIECGRRPCPGEFRFGSGSHWDEKGVWFVKCARCGVIEEIKVLFRPDGICDKWSWITAFCEACEAYFHAIKYKEEYETDEDEEKGAGRRDRTEKDVKSEVEEGNILADGES